MKKQAASLIRGLGNRLIAGVSVDKFGKEGPARLNLQHAPLGMLDVERITRVAAPIATITTRPSSSSSRW
ncbi:MAG: hypothetical protein Q8O67_26085 [Deltaproteobacteria bacterium]|nr:hypothetical protein [Deltaproteobacteria bacterium]